MRGYMICSLRKLLHENGKQSIWSIQSIVNMQVYGRTELDIYAFMMGWGLLILILSYYFHNTDKNSPQNRSRRPGVAEEIQLYSFSNLGARWGWMVNASPRPPNRGNEPVPLVQEAGWDPGPVWQGEENLTPTGIRSPGRPARSELLYRLRYRGPPTAQERRRRETNVNACKRNKKI